MTLAQQIIADLADVDHAKLIPIESFNDDDWYVYETDSKMLVDIYGHRWKKSHIKLLPGQSVARGMSAKYEGIWRIVK